MKIVLTGGGTGGHFYPLIAIAEQLQRQADAEKIAELKLYFFSDAPYDEAALIAHQIEYREVMAGKLRMGFSPKNIIDILKMPFALISAIMTLYKIYPDVVVGKGGYASFPTLFAARILRIPVVIHESDSVPGRVSKWGGRFALRIGLGYAESASFFPNERTAFVGQPVRRELLEPITDGAYEYLKLEPGVPTLVVLGGSSGAQKINNAVVAALPDLVKNFQVIHQTGKNNIEDVRQAADIALRDNKFNYRYKSFDFLNPLGMRMSAGVASVIISRAGANAIAEIASWGVPSIIVPITKSNGDHQRKNAYNYARAGGCLVMEEANFTPKVLTAEVTRIISDQKLSQEMATKAQAFFKPDAAQKMAQEIIDVGLFHGEE